MSRPARRGKVRAFTMIELLLALLFLSFAFLPIFNLFRYGHEGSQSSRMEVEGTNYASDMLNAFRNLSVSEISSQLAPGTSKVYNDIQACNELKKCNLDIKPVLPPFTRQVSVFEFSGQGAGFLGWLSDKLKRLQSVPCYLVIVDIDYEADGIQRRKPETFRMATVVTKP